ncbi:hypothetical protein AHGSH82_034160 [Aeromonas hydrophila]|nr:hypothetical protein AHGSH82_034160 [Aeromonas hydrophila]BBT63562.1 hypothetical protein WP8S18E02_33590 [Aeromonas hydrophila]
MVGAHERPVLLIDVPTSPSLARQDNPLSIR